MWTLLGAALAAGPPARLEPIPDTPMHLDLSGATGARAWEWREGLLTHPGQPFPAFHFEFRPSVQPDLARMPVPPDLTGVAGEDEVTFEPPLRFDHPILGPSFKVHGTGGFGAVKLEVRGVLFGSAEGFGLVVGVAFAGRGHLEAELEEVISRLRLPTPLPSTAFQTGEVRTASGYAVTLPEGWRARTDDEARRVSDHDLVAGVPEAFVGFDPSRLDDAEPPELQCRLSEGPVEVVDPARAPEFERAARSRLDVFLPSDTAQLGDIGDIRIWDVDPKNTPPAELIELGDRPAYLWRVVGRDAALDLERPGLGLTASWDQVALDCFVVTEIDGQDRTAEMEAMLRSIRVTDGEAHPMDLSTRAWYYRHWPFSHPLLEAWAFLGYGFVLGGIFVVRELRS